MEGKVLYIKMFHLIAILFCFYLNHEGQAIVSRIKWKQNEI